MRVFLPLLAFSALLAAPATAQTFGLRDGMTLGDFPGATQIDGLAGAYWVTVPNADKVFASYQATISTELGLCTVMGRSAALTPDQLQAEFSRLDAILSQRFGAPEDRSFGSDRELVYLEPGGTDSYAATLRTNVDLLSLSYQFGNNPAECSAAAIEGR